MIGLLLASCLTIAGCGNNGGKDTQIASTQQDDLEKQDSSVQQDSKTEKYEELARENYLLQEQRKYLSEQCSYYEAQVIGKSAEGFEKQDLMEELLQSRQSEAMQQDNAAEGTAQADSGNSSEEDFSVPAIDDTELENRVAELEADNQELQLQIEELEKQLEVYKIQYMSD